MTFTSQFFNQYKDDLLESVEDILVDSNFSIPDADLHYDLSFGRVILDLTNQKLDSFIFDSKKAKITAQNSQPYFVFALSDANLNFQLDFDFYSIPEWIKDSGSGIVNITNFDISMHIFPYESNGKLQFYYSDFEVSVANCSVILNGYTDFSKSINKGQDKFAGVFQNYLS